MFNFKLWHYLQDISPVVRTNNLSIRDRYNFLCNSDVCFYFLIRVFCSTVLYIESIVILKTPIFSFWWKFLFWGPLNAKQIVLLNVYMSVEKCLYVVYSVCLLSLASKPMNRYWLNLYLIQYVFSANMYVRESIWKVFENQPKHA